MPRVKPPKLTRAPSARGRVGGPAPPTAPPADVFWKNVVGVSVGFVVPNSHCWKYWSSLSRFACTNPPCCAATVLVIAMNAAVSALPWRYVVCQFFSSARNAGSPRIWRRPSIIVAGRVYTGKFENSTEALGRLAGGVVQLLVARL